MVATVRGCVTYFGYVARFDVKSYYSSMDHQIILDLLGQYQVTSAVISIVSEYFSLPDHNKSGKGMVAGGALSPLIGALYLMPLDKLMYAVLDDFKVEVHPKKRFIGTTRRGFNFLEYWLEPHRPLTPSQVSLTRLIDRSRQLLERTASITRVRQYVRRWLQWHHSGLRGLTARSSSLECFC